MLEKVEYISKNILVQKFSEIYIYTYTSMQNYSQNDIKWSENDCKMSKIQK